jgi:competence protein ComGC
VIITLIVVVLIIAVVIMFIPLIIKVLNAISQSGLKGIAESITGFLDKIWNGSVN